MKPSHEPPYWLLFGAGGMLAALAGPGIAWLLAFGPRLDAARVHAFARHPLGKAFLFFVVALFLWHAAHRLYHTIHDFGWKRGEAEWLLCYGVAAIATAAAALAVVAIGF